MPVRMQRTASLALAVVTLACQREPDDLREWMASDHQHAATETANQTPDTSNSAAQNPLGLDEVTIVAWRRNCMSCHGSIGRGDGPQAAMVKPRDLTDPSWQASVTDEQIMTVIAQGRGSMPAFQLPESTVRGLVRLIRLLKAGDEASAATPAASAQENPQPEDPAAQSAAGGAAGSQTTRGQSAIGTSRAPEAP